MSTLRHWFVRGLRFDTEVQYLVETARGLRYAHLPLKLPDDLPAGDGGLESVVQCAAIVGQMAIRRMPNLDYREQCTPEDIVGMLRTCLPTAFCEVLDAPESKVLEFGVLHALRSGGLVMVQFHVGAALHWAVVSGLELDADTPPGDTGLRALLLLDSHGSEPWACGHNVRMELAIPTADGVFLCRHLTGHIESAHLQCLVRVIPAPVHKTGIAST